MLPISSLSHLICTLELEVLRHDVRGRHCAVSHRFVGFLEESGFLDDCNFKIIQEDCLSD